MTTPRKLTLDDLWTLQFIGNIALSPDGRHIAFEMQSTDKEKNEDQCAIWLFHLDEHGYAVGEPRQLTSGAKSDTYFAWVARYARTSCPIGSLEICQKWFPAGYRIFPTSGK